jgi:hypothetical protein
MLIDVALLRRECSTVGGGRLDFKRLHREISNHAGIVICTEDPDRVGQAQRIAQAITDSGELKGKLIRVNRPPA